MLKLLSIFLVLLVLPIGVCSGERDIVLDESLDAFYHPETYMLPNGMRVVLKHRPEVKNTSIRLAVNLGSDHFPCDQNELPHVIEHMLFEGTHRHSSSELEQRVADTGSSWNAETSNAQTVYQFEAYSPFTRVALETLHEILTESLMDEEAMTRAKDAAAIESDNAESATRIWQSVGWGSSGSERLFIEMGLMCPPTTDPYRFTYEELMQSFQRFYVPGNMTLIVVGNFESTDIRGYVADSFGRIPAGDVVAPVSLVALKLVSDRRYESFGDVKFRETTDVGIAWPTAGYRGNERFSLDVLGSYLDTRLYNVLRNENQLSYGPGTNAVTFEDRGVFALGADTQRGNEDRVLGILRQELDEVLQDGMGREKFEKAKRSRVISAAMVDFNNADIADYYAEYLYELKDGDSFENYERKLMALDYETFMSTLRTFFAESDGTEYVDRSMLDSKRIAWILLACAGLLVFAIGVLRSHRRLRTQ